MPASRTFLVTSIALLLSAAACGSGSNGDQVPGVGQGSDGGGTTLGNPSGFDGGPGSKGDGGSPKDASHDIVQPLGVTINAIDTGLVKDETRVRVSGVVVLPVQASAGEAGGTAKCGYEAYLQDPNGPAPSGLRVYFDGLSCGDAGCACPPVGAVSTPIDALGTPGDQFDIVGDVETYLPAGAPTEHQIYVQYVTKTASAVAIAPVVVTDDDAGVGGFVHGGGGATAYEGMLVTLTPASGFIVTTASGGAFTASGIRFATDYLPAFVDGGAFPAFGSSWSSITGVARTAHGGDVAPRSPADFAP